MPSKPSDAVITYRHEPPTRRSISQLRICPRRPGHHWETSSGSVHARHTSAGGASNSRVIRISVPVGSVTTALPLLAIASLLRLEFLQHGVEGAEPLAPRPLVARHPVVDGLQRPAVEPVHPPAPVVARIH